MSENDRNSPSRNALDSPLMKSVSSPQESATKTPHQSANFDGPLFTQDNAEKTPQGARSKSSDSGQTEPASTPRTISSPARNSIVNTISKIVLLSNDGDDLCGASGMISTPTALDRNDDTSYRSFGKGLSRRNSMKASDTVRTKALDVETTDASHLSLASNFAIKPWELSLDAIKIAKDARIESFDNVQFLCNGKNSNIYKAKSGSEFVIIKKLAPDRATDERCRDEFKFEVEFLARASACESIVQVLQCGEDVDDKKNKAQVPAPFIVLECLNGGSMTYMLTKKRGLRCRPFASNLELYNYMVALASALNFCHFEFNPRVHVLHRDVKPDNIAFTEGGKLKLIDFGLSICIRRCKDVTEQYDMTGETGSLRYMAPEVIMRKPYNYTADVFSFGIVAWEMCTGVVPHAGQKREKFIENVVDKGLRPGLLTDPYGQKIVQPDSVKQMLQGCWAASAAERWSMDKVLNALIAIRDEEAAKPPSHCVCV